MNDNKIFFLDYEYFEYDVEDWTKLKKIVHNTYNDKARRRREKKVNLSQYTLKDLFTCSPVCVRKCRVKFAERGNLFPQ